MPQPSAEARAANLHVEPVMLGGIDAGSNAIRLVIVRAANPLDWHRFESERCAVRLGHNVFTAGRFEEATMDQAVIVFKHFAALFARYGVQHYRAVATSATREAKNGGQLIERLRRETGIRLEVIDGDEEAKLVAGAVTHKLGSSFQRGLILDLGGGSLELTAMQDGRVNAGVTAPLGTVRLMETFGMNRAMAKRDIERVRDHVTDVLQRFLPCLPDRSFPLAVGCGGNAECLARIASGTPRMGTATLSIVALEQVLDRMLSLDVAGRMAAYGVRRDRAEVMGFAALTLTTLGRMLGVTEFIVPAIGVREGIVAQLALERFPVPRDAGEREELLLGVARGFARSVGHDLTHGEKVRGISLSLFDQIAAARACGLEARLALEIAALLHDVGHVAGRTHHHRTGEYLVHHARLPGLDERMNRILGGLIRFHGRIDPEDEYRPYASLSKSDRRQVRLLTAILRLADGLDADRGPAALTVEVRESKDRVAVVATAGAPCDLALWGARRKSRLLERELEARVVVSLRAAGNLDTPAANPRARLPAP